MASNNRTVCQVCGKVEVFGESHRVCARLDEIRRRVQNLERVCFVILEHNATFKSQVDEEDYELLTDSWKIFK